MMHYIFGQLLTTIVAIVLSVAIYLNNKKNLTNRIFALHNLAIALWAFCFFKMAVSTTPHEGLFWARALHVGAILIPVFFLHFTYAFLKIVEKRTKIITLAYSIAFIMLIIVPTKIFVSHTVSVVGFKYFVGPAGVHYHLFPVYFATCVTYALWELFIAFRKSFGLQRNQIKYLFLAMLIGYCGGPAGFYPLYNIRIPAWSFYAVSVYAIIITYAILKYRLMDIKVVITSTGIFVAIYSIVLGIPFWLGFGLKLWMYSLISMGMLATAGPFIYGKLKERAQRAILHKQIATQHALKEFAHTLSQIKTEESLFTQTINKLYSLVLPKHIAIYTYSRNEKAYIARSEKAPDWHQFTKQIETNSTFVEILTKEHQPIFGEIADPAATTSDTYETVIIPFFAESVLYGFIIIGPKSDEIPYSTNDMEVFEILANNISLTVENILFWKEEKTRLMREEQIRRQRAMDRFASSLAHEIDNPVFGVQCSLEALKATLSQDFRDSMPADKLKYLEDTVGEILQNIKQTSKLIRAIREFSGQSGGELKPISMDEVAEQFTSMIEPQMKHDGITFIKEIENNIFITGNKIHLIEILMNLAGNSLHAVKSNSPDNKKIYFRMRKNSPETCLVEINDNGYGIDKGMLEDIFLDFVTTKVPGEGSGMGLARAKKIAETHKGKIWAYSEGKGKGAAFFIELPLLK